MRLPLIGEMRRALLMLSQYWFRQWLGAIRQQAITQGDVDQVLWHVVSPRHNELNSNDCGPVRCMLAPCLFGGAG